MARRRRDTVDVFIETLHMLLGHDRTADFIGQPHGEKNECKLCRPQLGPLDYETDSAWEARALRAGVRL